MFAGFLLAVLAIGDSAPAGGEYVRGLKLLEEKKYDDAIRAFESATAYEPAETEILKYRDAEGRHRHGYYPYYQVGRARIAQAKTEELLDVKKDRFENAARQLQQSIHAEAKAALAEAQAGIKDVLEAIRIRELNTPPPEIAALRTEVLALCDAKHFEEAFGKVDAALAAKPNLFDRREPLRKNILDTITQRQEAEITRYDTAMAGGLGVVALANPTSYADRVLPLLKPAVVAPEVKKDPAPKFKWLARLVELYEKEIDRFRKMKELPVDELLRTAEAFDQAAIQALDAEAFDGLGAARNLGQSLRLARLMHLSKEGAKPSDPQYRKISDAILAASAAARAKVEEDLKRRLEAAPDAPAAVSYKAYLENEIPYQQELVAGVKDRIADIILKYEQRVAADGLVTKAEGSFLKPAVVSDPEACKKVAQDLAKLESEAHFDTLPADVRARTYFTRALSRAFSGFLEAEEPAKIAEALKIAVTRAYALDANVDAPWKDRLSPRVKALFDQVRK